MISHLQAKAFKAVPYLETSSLMQRHKKGIQFATDKPTVIVGPNGSGKSALLTTLSLRFLAYFLGESCLDNHYVNGQEDEHWWTEESRWRGEHTWLKGLACETDNGPVRYYRPGHMPGNESSVAAAMMTGYFNEARAYARLVEHKSSGQQARAVLAAMTTALSGQDLPARYALCNWGYGEEPRKLDTTHWSGPFDARAEILKKQYLATPTGKPLLLMDEPEQSLDAKAEATLWTHIAKADCTQMQVIVATHSLYPLMHPEKFQLIESEKGFIKDVLALNA